MKTYRLTTLFTTLLFALAAWNGLSAQTTAVKTNSLYWLGGGNINGGLETALSRKTTLQLSASYNPWTYKENKRMHFVLAEPEIKFWLCERYEGHFFGILGHGAQFYGGFRDHLYDGYMAGGGVTYGYSWILSPHWSLEAEVGVGYEHLWYKRYPQLPCLKCEQKLSDNYIGPLKAALSFVYFF